MKKVLLVVVLILLALGAYVAAGPYLAVAAIKDGIANDDADKLAEHIDFLQLRQNIKDQLNAAEEAKRATAKDNNMFSALMSGFKAKLIEGMVDSIVTPEGLANLFAGKKALAPASSPSEEVKEERKEVFKDARFTYDSLDSFSIWIPNSDKSEMRLVLQRRGLTWKLVNLTLPQTNPS